MEGDRADKGKPYFTEGDSQRWEGVHKKIRLYKGVQ